MQIMHNLGGTLRADHCSVFPPHGDRKVRFTRICAGQVTLEAGEVKPSIHTERLKVRVEEEQKEEQVEQESERGSDGSVTERKKWVIAIPSCCLFQQKVVRNRDKY